MAYNVHFWHVYSWSLRRILEIGEKAFPQRGKKIWFKYGLCPNYRLLIAPMNRLATYVKDGSITSSHLDKVNIAS